MSDELTIPEKMSVVDEEVDRMIEEKSIDPDMRDTARMLFAGLVIGTSVDAIAEATGIDRDFLVEREARLRESKVWRGDETWCDWFSDGGKIAFLLDCMVADGEVRRITDEDATGAESDKYRLSQQLSVTSLVLSIVSATLESNALLAADVLKLVRDRRPDTTPNAVAVALTNFHLNGRIRRSGKPGGYRYFGVDPTAVSSGSEP